MRMRFPKKKMMSSLVITAVVIAAVTLSVLGGFNLFGSTTDDSSSDKTNETLKDSPHSSSTTLHVVLTGSIFGIVDLIIALVAMRIISSRDKRSSDNLEIQCELNNRAKMAPPAIPIAPVPPTMWAPTAPMPIIPQHHVQ